MSESIRRYIFNQNCPYTRFAGSQISLFLKNTQTGESKSVIERLQFIFKTVKSFKRFDKFQVFNTLKYK